MKHHKIAAKIACAMILLVVTSIIISDFSMQVQKALTAETYRTLSEVSKTYNKVFNDRIANNFVTMNMLSSHLADVHSASKEEVMAVLQIAVNEGGFTKMAVCGEDGVSLSNEGTVVDVSHRDYFHKAMSGVPDVSEPLTLTAEGEESMIVAVPLHRDGKVVGVLFGGYPLTIAGDHLLDTTYYSEGYGYIISPDGTIILSSDHSDKMVDGKNLLTFFEKTDFVEYSMEQLKAAIRKGESGSFAYRYEGQRRFISFTPSHVNDWYTFSLSSDAPMLQDERVNKQIVYLLVAKLAAVAALVFLWIVLGNRRHNKEMHTQEEELRRSEKRFSVAINASSGALFELDIQKQVYTHFENAKRVFGVEAETIFEETAKFAALPPDAFEDKVCHYFFHADDCFAIKTEMQKLAYSTTARYEARLRRNDNSYRWCRVDLSLIYDAVGTPTHLVGFVSDIDAIKTQAIRSEKNAQRDSMTGLYNKAAMETLANKALSEYPYGRHALMVLDVDDFKRVNDTLGHAFGDLVLMDVAVKLKTAFRNHDIVGRIGGDEFAILMKNIPNTSSVLKKGTELTELFCQIHVGKKQKSKISCSIGMMITEGNTDADTESFETLYRKADAALYQAKQDGKNQFVLYQECDADSYPIDSRKTAKEDLQSLKSPYTLEGYIFELLYTAKDFEQSIHMALSAIGRQYEVSRVTVFQNAADGQTTSNLYEWCNDGVKEQLAYMQQVPLFLGDASLFDCFDENGLLYCSNVDELPAYIRDILEEQQVLATLQVIIFSDEKPYGFIGFDDCKKHRVWTAEEIEKLSYLSKVLSVFLFRLSTPTVTENLHCTQAKEGC
ncbi:MAG: diguanylate cyclase [Clostridia bacterium]